MYHAKNWVLHCGEQTILWQTFQRGFDRLRKIGTTVLLEDYRGDRLLESLDGTIVERIVRILRLRKDEAHFLGCIGLTHGTECQDPRDRIFALSSMNHNSWIQPDYSLSVGDMYTAFTRNCIEHGCCETVLYHTSVQLADPVQRDKCQTVLGITPSWAVNWQDEVIVGASFWHDNHDDGRGKPEGYVDDQLHL